MYAALKIQEIESQDLRDGPRFLASGHVAMTSRTAPPVSGDLLNISCSGAAIKCYSQLRVGSVYNIEISGLGVFDCSVVRNFNGFDRHTVFVSNSPQTDATV